MNPYINPAMQSQDLGGLNPVYQNMAAQQQMQNQAAMQGQQLTQQAGQTVKGGMNPMAMAMMLRKKDPTKPDMMGTGQTPDYSNPYAGYDSGASSGSSGIE